MSKTSKPVSRTRDRGTTGKRLVEHNGNDTFRRAIPASLYGFGKRSDIHRITIGRLIVIIAELQGGAVIDKDGIGLLCRCEERQQGAYD